MKNHLLPGFKLTVCCMFFFCGVYPAFIWIIAQCSPNHGKGFIIHDKKNYYYENIGQKFDSDFYFWSRPSANSYNAAGSCGSNKGPSNRDYLSQIHQRMEIFILHHPGVKESEIPAELVTASGSGLDPHISPEAAYIQVSRIAKHYKLAESQVRALIDQSIEKPLWGILGPEKVNVLLLNLKLKNL